MDPVELILDLAIESDLRQLFIQPITPADDDELLAAMKHPRTVMTFSDAGAHVSQISDVSIQTHLLAYWVRQREAFTLEEAVRMITLVPATAWGLADRGLVREGFVADLNVFDPDTRGARAAHGAARSPCRRAATRAEGHRVPRHRRRRRGRARGW